VWHTHKCLLLSYIYKPATSSHAKPGLFETTTLTLLLASLWIFPFRKPSRTVTPELVLHHTPEFQRFPKFMAPQVHGFESSRICDFEASQVQDSEPSRVRDSEASRVRDSKRIRDSETSWVPDSRSSRFLCPWKHISRISWTSTFRGWQVSWIPQQYTFVDYFPTTLCYAMEKKYSIMRVPTIYVPSVPYYLFLLFHISRCVHRYILSSRYVTKEMYLKKAKRMIIWDKRSSTNW
jgi:hypothetical protein